MLHSLLRALSVAEIKEQTNTKTQTEICFSFLFFFPFFLGGGGRERIVNFFYLLLLFLRK